MNNLEAKLLVEESLKKLEESVKKEVNYLKEVADDKIFNELFFKMSDEVKRNFKC